MALPAQPQGFCLDALNHCGQDIAGAHKLRHTAAHRPEEHLIARTLLQHAPSIVDNDVLTERKDVGEIVRHDQGGDAPTGLPLHQFLTQRIS